MSLASYITKNKEFEPYNIVCLYAYAMMGNDVVVALYLAKALVYTLKDAKDIKVLKFDTV